MLTYIYSQAMHVDLIVCVTLILMPILGIVLKLTCLNLNPEKCQVKVESPCYEQAYVIVLRNQAYYTT